MLAPSSRFHRIALLGVSLVVPTAASAADLSWNGFGSAYYGQALSGELMPPGLSDQHANFTNFSLMGLNLGASINDDLSFATQFVALGSRVAQTDSFGVMAQWAFATYHPTSAFSIRVGRQLYPALLASEFVRVGYLLPFRQIPYETAGIAPFTRFDGFSVAHSFATGIGKATLGVFGGRPQVDADLSSVPGVVFNQSDLLGMYVGLDGEGWRVRVQASRFLSELNFGTPFPAAYFSGHVQVMSAGYRYDQHGVVTWGEYIMVRAPDGTSFNGGRYVGSGHGFYWLGGYRFGKFLPHYTFSQAANAYNIFTSTGLTNGGVTRHSIGLNYQAGNQAVIKLSYERVLIPQAQAGGYLVNQTASSAATSAGAIFAGLDFIF